jgi:hypothetical protein
MQTAKRWTDEDVAVLREKYDSLPVAQIAIQLGRTRASVYLRAHQMGLAKPHKPKSVPVTPTVLPSDAPIS